MPQAAKETVDVTSLLKGVLNGYPGSSAILREYLQNSDDAKAKRQIFLLDEQLYSATTLLDPILQASQGPALIAMNDRELSEEDWKALKQIHASSKTKDESQTGKNGLGFRASYHLTENPQILSGRTLMILDPHNEFNAYPGGMSIDIVDEGPKYQDQLAPFIPIMQDPYKFYRGTIFRLPLRTKDQANRSRIKNEATAASEIKELLESFGQNELEEAILFLKNISTIEIRHISSSGQKYFIGKATIDPRDSDASGLFTRQVICETAVGLRSRAWRFYTSMTNNSAAAQIMSKILGYDIGYELTKEKLVANVELAMPLGGPSIQGRLFTLLPLPIKTGFPLHFNATFALTPDRQSLKNVEETGLPESRERRLVEWNRAIFDQFGPTAWVNILSDLSVPSDCWAAWPPEEHDKNSYWANLIFSIIEIAIASRLSIFPLVSSDEYTALDDDSILLAPPDPKVSLALLARLELNVVQLPAHIFDILTSGSIQVSASVLAPTAVHKILRSKYLNDKKFSASQKDILDAIKYLVFSATSPTIENIFDLPLLFHEDRSPAPLARSSMPPHIVPATADEASVLFSSRNDMLSWASMSCELRDYLGRQASSSPSRRSTNVVLLTPDDVINCLEQKFGRFDSSKAELAAVSTVIDWLACFWKWVMGWNKRDAFFSRSKEFHDLHLLPTDHQTVRKMSSQVMVFKHINNASVAVFTQLGIHPLHSDLSRDDSLLQILVKYSFAVTPQHRSYLSFLANNFVVAKLINLRVGDHVTIHESLYETQLAIKSTLSSSAKDKFSQLPIFHIRQKNGKESVLAPVFGERQILAKVDTDVPLPLLPGRPPIYVDVSKPVTQKLIAMVGSSKVHSELDLLQLAIDNWRVQSSDLQDKFIKRIFDNLSKISESQLKTLPFVTVDNSNQRVPPCDLIDPSSPLSQLYEKEKGKFPAGKFATGHYLSMMRAYHFLKSELDLGIVSERIEYLSNAVYSPSTLKKAKAFVRILDDNWEDAYGPSVVQARAITWLPSEPLVSPSKSRDRYEGLRQHPHLYDLVLEVLAFAPLQSPGFRKALGWSDGVSTDVLLRQFSSALTPSSTRKSRVITLIKYFGKHQISAEFLVELRKIVQDKEWVPVSSRDPDALSRTKYALLSETNLPAPFSQVYWRDISNDCIDFLRAMGCTSRPPLAALYEVLDCVPSITTSIIILEEITQYADYDRAAVMVPTDDDCICSLDSVYYQDVSHTSILSTSLNKSPLHRGISKGLAEQLKVPFLSAEILELGMDEDDDEEQMGEDLRDRIEGFLRENDILYGVNEFFANADDAKATKFSILLDSRGDDFGTRVISPSFETLQSSSYIIFHNDAVLSEHDFLGLKKVGRGGKTDRIDTIGRHGLGALAFYYFTDTPFVISGEDVMILDPTSGYLPNITRSGQKRTSLHRKISGLVRQYPDQLKRFEGLFGFSSSLSEYDGTMFCLPLKGTIPRKSCDSSLCRELIQGPYKELAQNAFFFTTHLEEISAQEYTRSRASDFWSMSSTRSERCRLGDQYTRHEVGVNIRVREEAPVSQKWIVSTCHATIPIEHSNTAANLKLPPNSKMTVQIALDPEMKEGSRSNLFSTLRLPKPNFLPFHIDARFAISSNRQSLIFTAGGSQNYVDDPKTAFNAWILGLVVPPLYLSTLEYLKHCSSCENSKRYDARVWWLNPSLPPDEITIFMRKEILKLIPSSAVRVFRSANDKWISFQDAVFSRDELPSVVCRVLTRLRVPTLVIVPRPTDLNKLSSAKLVDTKYVKKAFTERIVELKAILEAASSTYTIPDIFAILDYIKDEAPLAGFPLSILADDSLDFLPQISERPVYRSTNQSHCDLFSTTAFMHSSCPEEIIQALKKDTSVNLKIFSANSVPKLVQAELEGFDDDDAREEWLERFWNAYDGLPGPPPLSLLESPNLKLIKCVSSSHLSICDCRPDTVVQDPGDLRSWLVPILKKLDINVLKFSHSHPPKLVQYINTAFPSLLINILQCFMNKNVLSFPTLNEGEHGELASWMRETITYAWSGKKKKTFSSEKQRLLRLPIWRAQLGGRQQLLPASDILVLPTGLDMDDISYYLRSDIAVASSRYNYSGYSEYFKSLSLAQIFNVVQLPAVLHDDSDRRMYKKFVKAMIAQVSRTVHLGTLKFPDCSGTLRFISQLYDHNVGLFAQDLKYTTRSSFLHPDFRDLSSSRLELLGFQHKITFATFKNCARTIEALGHDSTFSANPQTRMELMRMATCTFHSYNTTLPSLLMTNASLWNELDAISFIRPRTERRQGVTYDVDPSYCTQLVSPLLAPSQIIRPEFEPMAWTQYALPLESLSEEVLAVNRTLGVPNASLVVEHLKVLATQIALRHPGDRTLLSDLKATYSWLNKNVEEAREALVCAVDVPLFLNVEDPLTSAWIDNWQPASKLLLNLMGDSGLLKTVKPFLRQYEQLLLSAGCHSLDGSIPTDLLSTESSGDSPDLAQQFSEMRREGRLTDLFFEPTIVYPESSDPDTGSPELSAHKVFLAATLPYFQAKFDVEKRGLLEDSMEVLSAVTERVNDHDLDSSSLLKKLGETTLPDKFRLKSQKFKFEGTGFAAKAFLDFIYTGTFEYPASSNIDKLLYDFLGLLSIADEWDMPSLKAKVTREIVVENQLMQRLPHEFPIVLEAAEMYHAEELEEYLKYFRENNGPLLDDLIR